MWLQDSESKSWFGTYTTDSRNVYCKVRNNTITAKYCEFERHAESKK